MRIARNDLARLLTQVTKAVESRNTIPILACVKLVNEPAKKGSSTLTATATDLDVEVSGSIAASGDAMAFCVNAKMLAGIVNKVGGDEITIEPADKRVVIKSGRSRFTLDILPVDDFPALTAGDLPVQFIADLATMFAPVQFAISDETQRHYLNGINLEPGIATATDGHRLSSNKAEAWPDHKPVIIPRKAVGLLPKGELAVSLSDTKIRFVTSGDGEAGGGGITIISKLIDGTFPDYERVIPEKNDKIVVFDNAALRAAVERVSLVSAERARGVKLSIADGAIDLWVRGEGEAADTVSCEYEGPAIDVGFSAAYLVEVLANLPAGDVKLALADGGSPALFTSAAAEGLRTVLMPMRV